MRAMHSTSHSRGTTHARGRALGAAILFTSLAAVCLAGSTSAATPSDLPAAVHDSYHQDGRSTPKLQFAPAWNAPAGLSGEALAREFVAQHARDYQLPSDLSNLGSARVQESLLGRHYHFDQSLGGYPVDQAEIIVSILNSDGSVYRVFNNTYPVKQAPVAPAAVVDAEMSYDIAWEAIHAHGELNGPARQRTVYVPVGESFQLQSIVELAVEAPFGDWQVRIDAATGRVIQIDDLALPRMKSGEAQASVADRINAYQGPLADRLSAFARESAREAATVPFQPAFLATGTGKVFDPDPRTTLQNETIQDTSPAGTFTPAYFTRTLQDITLSAGTYSLTGPWVTIANFESPNTPPSTTGDGNWIQVRGNNAFDDAVTYFHLDQSQRYMQSLGFVGGHGIQQGSIFTDTDGLSGADNSHFVPSTNRLAFGHGCVDDDEDADVILHEYGHAIQYSINNAWGGGDTGAMGEGFGDYWAGSYSYSTPNGQVFHPEWVFSWDGHGVPASCWAGRVLNQFGAQYVPGTTYGAHQSIPGGYQSDELWSTPLFQSLVTLMGQGRPRTEVDKIVLESHFGLGSGMTMPDMATATVATAALLQPGGPHADVFTQKFVAQNILQVPTVNLTLNGIAITEPGGNGVADPGETVALKLTVKNVGTLGAVNVNGTLTSSTVGVTIVSGTSTYPDIPIGSSKVNNSDFVISISPGFTCGDKINLTLALTYGASGSANLAGQIGTGVVIGVSQSISPNTPIPDNNTTGITSNLVVSGTGAFVTSSFNVDINITHTYIGDLKVTLKSPAGTSVILHNRTGGSADNLVGNYPGTLTPAQPLSAFLGQAIDGTWQLNVADLANIDTGTLNSWGINDIQGYQCQTSADVPGGGSALRFGLAPISPNPVSTDATLHFSLTRGDRPVSLDIVDISGRVVRNLASGTFASGAHSLVWDLHDGRGRRVGAGVYFARLRQDGREVTEKMLMIR
ncbi:MAG: proprotein convertase P-domain-containing protein [Candidatus Eisenbacteria bacterium]